MPEEWKEDFDKVTHGMISDTSQKYKDYIRGFWPVLNEKGLFDEVFGE